jgi:hypothetical protein
MMKHIDCTTVLVLVIDGGRSGAHFGCGAMLRVFGWRHVIAINWRIFSRHKLLFGFRLVVGARGFHQPKFGVIQGRIGGVALISAGAAAVIRLPRRYGRAVVSSRAVFHSRKRVARWVVIKTPFCKIVVAIIGKWQISVICGITPRKHAFIHGGGVQPTRAAVGTG